MTTQEAIGMLKKNILEHLFSTSTLEEAIYTVVAELEKPTYTSADMDSFAEWLFSMTSQWIYDPTDKVWFQKHSTETKTTTQLREMWEDWKAKQRVGIGGVVCNTWYATNQLRWKQKELNMVDGTAWNISELQQMWQSDKGEQKWEAVPFVE